MKQILFFLSLFIFIFLAACHKDDGGSSLLSGSIAIEGVSTKDTLVREISITKDTTVVIGIKAVLNGQLSFKDHIVTFRVDTSWLSSFRDKYGDATLLPYANYLFFRSQCRISAGTSIYDSIQLNLVTQTALRPETRYVLPVLIDNVDGNTEAMVPRQVLYIVVKSGKAGYISKSGWSIVTASSELTPSTPPEAVLDNDDINTVWKSAIQPMPQYLVIDFGNQISFTGVTYRTPPSYYAGTVGGYPTKVKIEVSTDGVSWTDKGSYPGVTTPVVWSQNIGLTKARYMRFTILEAKLYGGRLSLVVIGGIGLTP